MSKYNLIRGEAFISGECVSVIEDSGFTNVEQVIAKVLMSMHDDVLHPNKVQIMGYILSPCGWDCGNGRPYLP